MGSRVWGLSVSLVLLAGCGPAAPRQEAVRTDPTVDDSYGRAVAELAALNLEARDSFKRGYPDRAAELIERGEPLSKKVMSVPQPTLEAAEAASDLDQLYGDMLFSNRNYGWARLEYQKNLALWKHWAPQTEESESRRKQAESSMAECDRQIGGGDTGKARKGK